MNVAIVGYGRMGKQVERILADRNHRVTSLIDPKLEPGGASESGPRRFKSVSDKALEGCDVAIEFSLPDGVRTNISEYTTQKVSAVIGTTGWFDSASSFEQAVKESGIGVVYGSNFSVGAHVFLEASRYAASLVANIEDYDLVIHEVHHNKKVDSPSGTALTLANAVLAQIPGKERIFSGTLDRAPKMNELQVSSSRVGSVPGTHTLMMDSDADTIEVSHRARNRGGFALGAVLAAEWVVNNPGMHGIESFMKALLRKE